jgi:hypothetical protein
MPTRNSICLLTLSAALTFTPGRISAQEPAPEPDSASFQNCTYQAAPDAWDARDKHIRAAAYERALRFARTAAKSREAQAPRTVHPSELPRRNFIDEEIFARLESGGVLAAPLSTDEEFLRRITLDLTGRIPSAAEIREFLADSSPNKRSAAIDRLLYSPEFIDKWAMWLGDLLGNARINSNRNLNIEGRNRWHDWIRSSLAHQKSFREIAWESVAWSGNNYDYEGAPVNFIVRSFHPMGPAQDTYDMILVRTATAFLGMAHYDCLLCHDGAGHLNAISVWGAKAKREEAQRMSAHFSRVVMNRYNTADRADFYFDSYSIVDNNAAGYVLNTTSGNRPNRVSPDPRRPVVLTPVYRDGRGASGNWRVAFADAMVADPMFARNFANRLWKAMFNLALAEPVDALDPARLDPNAEPPRGWTHQASHPALLERLAQYARDNDFNLRETLRFIAESAAYQLSSRYDGEWNTTNVSLFARHIPRRLEGEEVHDAILKATGTSVRYTIEGWGDQISWAMQVPEPTEPRTNGIVNFLNSFNRGNRDTQQRTQAGSILMWLNLMNNAFVNDRVRLAGANGSPYLAALARNTNYEQVVEEMFLTFLSRRPSEYEKNVALNRFAAATTPAARNTLVEDLAWALINKVDFLFSY